MEVRFPQGALFRSAKKRFGEICFALRLIESKAKRYSEPNPSKMPLLQNSYFNAGGAGKSDTVSAMWLK
jgi:hypothetical protein